MHLRIADQQHRCLVYFDAMLGQGGGVLLAVLCWFFGVVQK